MVFVPKTKPILRSGSQTSGIYRQYKGVNIKVRSRILLDWFSELLPESFKVKLDDPMNSRIPPNITVGSVPKIIIYGNGTEALLTLDTDSFRLTDLAYDRENFKLLIHEFNRIFGREQSNKGSFTPVWKNVSLGRIAAAARGGINLINSEFLAV